jgi:hypothetical protein
MTACKLSRFGDLISCFGSVLSIRIFVFIFINVLYGQLKERLFYIF